MTRPAIHRALILTATFAITTLMPEPAHSRVYWPSDQRLQRCFVFLPAIEDKKLKRWCLTWSRRMP